MAAPHSAPASSIIAPPSTIPPPPSSPNIDVASASRPSMRTDLSGILHLLTCGSVDDGKSTLIGRLLWDVADIPEDQKRAIVRASTDGQPDLSLLLDGLVAEREQGITIDIAWRYFDTASRRLVIIDSPGHEQYTRNMTSGASHADAAIMLIDARHGVKRQTRRHAAILDLVGVRHVVLAVNKMDLVDWSQQRFEEIARDFAELTANFSFRQATALPVSAIAGDNVTRRSANLSWFTGPTLLEYLEELPGRGSERDADFRLPVQTVLRGAGDFRGLAGLISTGQIQVGDEIRDVLSGQQARVRRIATMDGDLARASAGQSIVLQLDRDLDIARGAILAASNALPHLMRRFEARMVWLADKPLDTDRGLLLRTATDQIPVSAIEVRARLELDTMTEHQIGLCATNDIVLTSITLIRPAAIDTFATHRETGSFVLVDPLSGATVAGGIVVAIEDNAPTANNTDAFRLTREIVLSGICADIASKKDAEAEIRRRTDEVVLLLQAAGISVDVEEPGSR